VLLIGSGLLMKSFMRLSNVERGYDPSHVLISRVHAGDHHSILGTVMPGNPEYEARTRARSVLFREILDRVRGLPGVVDATTTASLPLQGDVGFLPLQIDGSPDERRHTRRAEVGPGYFRAMDIPLLRGEVFSGRDQSQEPGNDVVVSQTLARTHWPGEDPIGENIGFWECCDLTIIGVVGDVDDRGVDDLPFNSMVDPKAVVYTSRLGGDLLVRTSMNPRSLVDAVRTTYSDLLDGFILEFDTLDGLHSATLSRPRFYLLLVGVFSAVALALAVVGLYGVVAHSVSRRTREVGVRMALGADSTNVRAMVVRQAMVPVLLGVVAGIVGAFALTRALASLLYGMDAVDPLTYAGVVAILVVVAACASYLPARRASRVDPLHALRYE
jgi:predicted permease